MMHLRRIFRIHKFHEIVRCVDFRKIRAKETTIQEKLDHSHIDFTIIKI